MTKNAGLLCFCTLILLGVFRAAGAQSFEECDKTHDTDPVGCVALEISEQRDGVRVQVMHHDGSLFLHFSDEFLREIVTLEPGFFVRLEPYLRIGFTLESFDSSGQQIRHYGREGAPDPELFVPIATRSFSTPVVTHGTEASGSCDDYFPHVVIDELGFWNDIQGFPIEACEGKWTLYEGTFRSLGIIPDVLSVWSSEAQDYKIRTVATASLTIIHHAEPADGTDFNYTVGFSDETERTAFVLDDADVDDGDGIGDTYVLEDPVLAGTYEIAHDESAGVLDSAVCTGGGDAGTLEGSVLTVDVRGTEDVVCEIFTSKLGSASVNLDMTPSSEQEVAFSGDLGAFSLDDDPDTAMPADITFVGLEPGTYDMAVFVPDGWDLTGIQCDDANSGTDIGAAAAVMEIDPGENVSCTFELTQSARLVVELNMMPEYPLPVAFGGGLGQFTLIDDGQGEPEQAFEVEPGHYAISASLPEGWTMDDLTCTLDGAIINAATFSTELDLAAGDEAGCTWSFTAALADLAIDGQVEREADDPNRVRVVVDVTNHGPAPAGNVLVSGDVSAGATLLDSDCELGGGMESLTWQIGALADGVSTRCVLMMALPETRGLNLELTVTGEQEETVPSTNTISLGLGALSATPLPMLGWVGLLLLMILLPVSALVIVKENQDTVHSLNKRDT